MMRKNYLSIAVVLFLTMALLCGCAEKQVNYDLEETEQDIEEDNISELAQFADGETWKEELEGVLDNNITKKIYINAKITLPEAESMSVIEVKKPEFDAAYKEQLVNAVFDGEKVFYYDDERLPKSALLEKIEEYEKEIADVEWMIDESYFADEADETLLSWKSEVSEYQEKIDICQEALATAPENYIPVTEYEGDAWLGTRNGISYILHMDYSEDTINDYQQYFEDITLEPLNIYDVCPEELREAEGVTYVEGYSEYTESNQCELTMEEARSIAEQELAAAGFSNMVFVQASSMWWLANEDSDGLNQTVLTDGYYLQYEFGIDELSITGFGTAFEYTNNYKNEAPEYSMNASCEIYVTENGIISMAVHNPIETVSVTKEVELLPLESVQSIICNELKNNLSQFSFFSTGTNTYLTALDLIYFRVPDETKEGYYSYVPTWRLYEKNSPWYRNPVFINAIDGSVIHVFYE